MALLAVTAPKTLEFFSMRGGLVAAGSAALRYSGRDAVRRARVSHARRRRRAAVRPRGIVDRIVCPRCPEEAQVDGDGVLREDHRPVEVRAVEEVGLVQVHALGRKLGDVAARRRDEVHHLDRKARRDGDAPLPGPGAEPGRKALRRGPVFELARTELDRLERVDRKASGCPTAAHAGRRRRTQRALTVTVELLGLTKRSVLGKFTLDPGFTVGTTWNVES